MPANTTQDSIAAPAAKAEAAETLYYKDRKFDKGLKEKYSDTEFQYENKTVAKSQWQRFWEWVARVIDRIFNFGHKTQKADGFTIFIRILAFVVIGLAVYLIARAILNNEGYWIFGRGNKKIQAFEIDEENIHEMDFGKLVDETKQTGNYKLTVRYYYLWLLKKLSSREIIDWHWDKTNSDYLYEIRDNNLRKDFEYLSYVYDYSWYGDFPLDEMAFAKAEKAFRKTLNTL
ncbi:DUF4129 domain-containing protein [Flavobacterium album]|uniref:DUF4129 domain-containing protein n=2 Tax=Flavobacterium album TaxID=2175091 RepID=A0A2S1R262_9FLAO|nr:DUF4129 domain-containing protein [Flavobacterium album]